MSETFVFKGTDVTCRPALRSRPSPGATNTRPDVHEQRARLQPQRLVLHGGADRHPRPAARPAWASPWPRRARRPRRGRRRSGHDRPGHGRPGHRHARPADGAGAARLDRRARRPPSSSRRVSNTRSMPRPRRRRSTRPPPPRRSRARRQHHADRPGPVGGDWPPTTPPSQSIGRLASRGLTQRASGELDRDDPTGRLPRGEAARSLVSWPGRTAAG